MTLLPGGDVRINQRPRAISITWKRGSFCVKKKKKNQYILYIIIMQIYTNAKLIPSCYIGNYNNNTLL